MADAINEDEQNKAWGTLDALMQEGLDSGPSTPMTPQDWIDIRQEAGRLAEE